MSLSIAIQLEAEGYSNRFIPESGIRSWLSNRSPDKHITLAIINIPFTTLISKLRRIYSKNKTISEILDKLIKSPRKLNRRQIDLIAELMEKYLYTKTSEFVLHEIKPIIDRADSIDLEFVELDLWPSGHLVAIFDPDQNGDFDRIVDKTRRFLRKLFPKGEFNQDRDDVIPHLSLAKYGIVHRRMLEKKIKQPNRVPDYRLISKRWIIYPTVRFWR